MYPKLNESSLDKVQKIELDGIQGFDVFSEYYKAFSKLINIFIEEENTGLLEPMLRMFAQTTNYFEVCLKSGEASEVVVDNYVDGIKWVFEECAPAGYVFNGTEYVKDG
jgi:hypothetical protein